MRKSIFYHAGCPVCVSAEAEIIHLGEQKEQIEEAAREGVESVPALLTPNGQVLHINFGASLDDLRA